MSDLYSDDPKVRLKQVEHDGRVLRNTRKTRCLLMAVGQLRTGRPYLVLTPEMIAMNASAIFGKLITSEQAKEFYEAWLRSISLFDEVTREVLRNFTISKGGENRL